MYQYSNGNLLENPQKYQKTPFLGNFFLESYLSSRENYAKNLQSKSDKKITVKEFIQKFEQTENPQKIINAEKFSLEKLLRSILIYNNNSQNDFPEHDFIIDIFLKKFEVRKKLFTEYNSKFQEQTDNFKNLKNYIYFSLLCLMNYNKTKNLKFLNVVLKLNDTICSQIEKINEDEEIVFFKYVLLNEKKCIIQICNNKGIEI